MKRVLLGSFAAAVAMFIWGWVFWGVIGMILNPYKPVPDPHASVIVAAAKAAFTESAVYRYPHPGGGSGGSDWEAQHREGPIVEIVYHSEGAPPMNPKMMVLGFLHMWFTAFVVGLIMNQFSASARLSSFRDRLVFVIILALLSSLWIDTGRYIWFYHPFTHELFHAVYHISGLTVAGLVLAAIVKRSDHPAGHR
jgi:hypothetical protein